MVIKPASAIPSPDDELQLAKPNLWRLAWRTASRTLDPLDNSVYSPACIFAGLRALSLGAAGTTAKELEEMVGGGIPEGDWLGLERNTRWAYEGYAGCILTGVWLDVSASPDEGFEAACEQNGATVTKADLSSSDAGMEISRWIADATDGFVTPNIKLDPLTLACVSSVLYLTDAWVDSFPRYATEFGTFHAEAGDIKAHFMVGEFDLDVSDENDVGTFVALPLFNGASMLLVLPKEGQSLSDLLGDQHVFDLAARFAAKEQLVELHLPKFSCESTIEDMAGVLEAAGFSTASSPNLSRMTGMASTPVTYAHGTKVAVDEGGIEAGSYFAMPAAGAAPDFDKIPPEPRVITFDRSFLYFVISRTGLPLLVGVVAKPEADEFAWLCTTSVGEEGSECGEIIEEEEIPGACLITLEADCPTAPFGITCGVYGIMMHTTWAETFPEAMEKYEGMKRGLRTCVERLGDDTFDPVAWCHSFTETW